MDFPTPNAKRRRLSPADSDGSQSDLDVDEFHTPPKSRPSRRSSDSGGSAASTDSETKEYVANVESRATVAPSRVSRIQASTKQANDAGTDATTTPSTPVADSNFASLSVAPWLVHTLASLSITKPTPIQQSCIPPILAGRDCIGGSRTGSGKTIAFAIPLLQKWAEDPFGIYAVVLTPTRELALQIYEQFQALGAPQNLKVVLVTGGSEMRPQALALSQRPHIVVATPGRLADHIQTSGKETTIGLSRAKAVVLDEADRLLASGSGSMLPDLNVCLSALPPPTARLTLLFTATVTPEVRALKSQARGDRPPVFVSEISDPFESSASGPALPPTLKQTYLQVPSAHKPAFLHVLLQTPSFTKESPSIIIFTNRTTTADHLHRTLLHLEHPATALHSELPQRQRAANLSSFRALKARILVATDVASRGLDIPSVAYVINYDVPRDPTDYVHRVGRTARASRIGTSVTFVGQRDVDLVLAIESYVGGKKMDVWQEEGVNLETRVVKGRTLKDVGEARMEAYREVEQGRDVNGWRRGTIKKDRKRTKT
jgi:ATP-dependent RNA helicase DDX49/DBP8